MSVEKSVIEKIVIDKIVKEKQAIIDIANSIHQHPELGNQEHHAQQLLGKYLQKEQFNVTYGLFSHKTGFIARKSSAKAGANISLLAEYDALPDIGHGCGHNLIGAASVGAGIALGSIIDEIGGTVTVIGTPAEEGGDNGSAKGTYVNEGLFNDIDAALMFHPSSRDSLTPNSQSVEPIDIEFFGRTAHAAGCPEKGINALYALLQFFQIVHAYQSSQFRDLNIYGVITDGGKVPNIIPDYAKARFYVRATSSAESLAAVDKIKEIVDGINRAFATTSKVSYFQNRVDHFIINRRFDQLFQQKFAEYTGKHIDYLPKRGGSTDAANVSHVIPIIHPNLAIGDETLAGHTIEFTQAACSEKGIETLILATKLLAVTALSLYQDPSLLNEIKASHNK